MALSKNIKNSIEGFYNLDQDEVKVKTTNPIRIRSEFLIIDFIILLFLVKY